MLSADQLRGYLAERTDRWIFRWELLDAYEVASDGGDFARHLAGEIAPTPERKLAWLRELIAEDRAGINRHRVRVLSTPLRHDYLRYECEWGYLLNAAAGEDIYILDLSEQDKPAGLVDHDFWLTDTDCVVGMRYDQDGRFVGAEPIDNVEPYRRTRQAALAVAEPFVTWWVRHPEEWRDPRRR